MKVEGGGPFVAGACNMQQPPFLICLSKLMCAFLLLLCYVCSALSVSVSALEAVVVVVVDLLSFFLVFLFFSLSAM